MSWDRKLRQEAILREKIAVIVCERLADPRIGFVTITKVELSKDKKIAKVFYTALGSEGQIRATQRALHDGRGRVQELLAPTLRMRTMPELRFIFDAQVEKESKVRDLIAEVTAEREAREAEEAARRAAEGGEGAEAPEPDGDPDGDAERAAAAGDVDDATGAGGDPVDEASEDPRP